MFKIAKNNTRQTQQIMFTDGSGQIVYPGDSLKINLKKISHDELERVMKFFVVENEKEIIFEDTIPSTYKKKPFGHKNIIKDGGKK